MAARRYRGRWIVDFRYGEKPRRKRYRLPSPIDTKTGAVEYEAILRIRLARGEPIEGLATASAPAPSSETFASFAGRWVATYVVSNNKPSEQRAKSVILNRHLLPIFGEHAIGDIDTQAIESFKAEKLSEGLKPKTINNHLALLSKCLRTAEEWGVIARAPRMRPLHTPEPEIDYLTADECVQLLSDTAEPAWRDMAIIGLRTGLRLGELLALERRDADLGGRLLTVSRSVVEGIVGTPKSHRTRYLPMSADVCEVFARAPRVGLLFPGRDGAHQRVATTAERAMKRMCRRVGLRPIGWHTLRHTFATQLVTSGAPLPVVQKLLGHANIATTMRYAHLAPSELRGAVDILEQSVPFGPVFSQKNLGTNGHDRSA